MEHAVTVGDVAWFAVVGVVLIVAVLGIFGLLALLNPFRSGH